MNRSRIPLAILGGAVLVATALAVRPGAGVPVPQLAQASAAAATDPGALTPFFRFTGSGTVTVKPDRAQIGVGVDGAGKTSPAALQAAGTRIARVARRMKELGVADSDLQTSGASTYQDADTKVWHAQVSLTVNVKDVAKAGALLSAANAAGAGNVWGPSFSVADSHAAYAQALGIALDDARAKADTAAAQLGVHVTGIVSVDESPSGDLRVPVPLAKDAATSSGAALPIETGTQDVAASVTVVFSYTH